jgi:hypothetical protein
MSIIRQQLEQEFGDEFPHVWQVTQRYVKGLISKPWWVNRRAMIVSEGELGRMTEMCLLFVVEKGDEKKGRQAYTSYLSEQYGTSSNALNALSFREGDHVTWSSMGAYSQPSQAPFRANSVDEPEDSVDISPPRRGSDDDRLEFLRTYRRVGKRECARIYGLTPQQARSRRDTIRRGIQKRVVLSS